MLGSAEQWLFAGKRITEGQRAKIGRLLPRMTKNPSAEQPSACLRRCKHKRNGGGTGAGQILRQEASTRYGGPSGQGQAVS